MKAIPRRHINEMTAVQLSHLLKFVNIHKKCRWSHVPLRTKKIYNCIAI